MKRPTENDLMKLLQNIEKGKISITLDEKTSAHAQESENGIYFFDTSTKWRIGVFVDCGWVDYVDSISHGGTKIDYRQLQEYYPEVEEFSQKYRTRELSEKVWGIKAKMYSEFP